MLRGCRMLGRNRRACVDPLPQNPYIFQRQFGARPTFIPSQRHDPRFDPPDHLRIRRAAGFHHSGFDERGWIPYVKPVGVRTAMAAFVSTVLLKDSKGLISGGGYGTTERKQTNEENGIRKHCNASW